LWRARFFVHTSQEKREEKNRLFERGGHSESSKKGGKEEYGKKEFEKKKGKSKKKIPSRVVVTVRIGRELPGWWGAR